MRLRAGTQLSRIQLRDLGSAVSFPRPLSWIWGGKGVGKRGKGKVQGDKERGKDNGHKEEWKEVVVVGFGPPQPATWSYHAADCQPTTPVPLVSLVQSGGTLYRTI